MKYFNLVGYMALTLVVLMTILHYFFKGHEHQDIWEWVELIVSCIVILSSVLALFGVLFIATAKYFN